MKKLKFLSLILLFAIITANFFMPSANALSDPNTKSKSVLLLDAATGNVLFSKNGDEKAYPASTTKIMTILLAVEAVQAGKVSLTDSVTASEAITFDLIEDGSTSGIVPGETMTLENLLYCAMLSSANEACNIIAEHIGGSISNFVEMMNERAKEIGCTDTHFANTHGLPDHNHYTTANDLAKISLAAYSNPYFMEICSTITKTIPATNKSEERHLSNTNGLINRESKAYPGFYYEYASGMKTGYTNDAGYCLVSTASKNDMKLLCVVLGGQAIKKSDNTDFTNFSDSIEVYNWAINNYSYRDIIGITDLVKDIPVKMGRDADHVTVHPLNAVKALMPNDEDKSSFESKITIYSEEKGEKLVAPIKAGEVLGEITIERDGVIFGRSQLVAVSSIDLSYSQFIGSQIVNTFKKPGVIVFVIFVLGLIGFYIYLVIKYRDEKRKREAQIEMRRKAREMTEEKKHALPRRSAVSSGYFEEKDSLNTQTDYFSKSAEEKEAELQAERDYFDEFFGRNKRSN